MQRLPFDTRKFLVVLTGQVALVLIPAFAVHSGPAPVALAAGASIAVGNCDDSGPGSLRAAIAGAASGDTIDMSTLPCRLIDLTSGVIAIPQHDLSLVGGPPALMKVDAHDRSSVFRHSGTGTLYIKRMNIARGIVSSDTEPLGGCLYSAGNLELVDSVIHGCRAKGVRHVVYGAGGGIYALGAVKLVHSRMVDNLVPYGYGGAIFTLGGLTTSHSRICGNRVHGGVGVVFVNGGMALRYTTFCNNQGNEGIFAQTGTIVIANSTISGNVGSRSLFLWASPNTGTTTIVNSTISGNTGAPIIIDGKSPKSIVNSTIAFNQLADDELGSCGPARPAIYVTGPEPVLLDSTIISNNLCNGVPGYSITKPENGTTTLVGANNLITGPSNMALPAETIVTDPELTPLADNGGPTLTHALMEGSPAIDSGNNEAGLEFDQRGKGHPRVNGLQTDIGAYER